MLYIYISFFLSYIIWYIKCVNIIIQILKFPSFYPSQYVIYRVYIIIHILIFHTIYPLYYVIYNNTGFLFNNSYKLTFSYPIQYVYTVCQYNYFFTYISFFILLTMLYTGCLFDNLFNYISFSLSFSLCYIWGVYSLVRPLPKYNREPFVFPDINFKMPLTLYFSR